VVGEMRPRNPYLDEAGQPQLRRSVVVFVDILGYQDMTRRAIRSGDGQGFLRVLRETFSRAFAHLKITEDLWAGEPAPWTVKTFSDNIAIGYPILHRAGEAELAVITRRLGEFQLEMTLGGFFIRGAVAVGDLYMDDQMVFGPALLDAYDAEQRLARDPRIVLTESAMQALRDELKRYPEAGTSWHHDAILCDADAQHFVNYLDGVVAYKREMGYSDRDAMARHREIITKRLTEFASDPPRWVKYVWAAGYHNCFCEKSPDFGDDLRVDISDIKVRPARLSAESRNKHDV